MHEGNGPKAGVVGDDKKRCVGRNVIMEEEGELEV